MILLKNYIQKKKEDNMKRKIYKKPVYEFYRRPLNGEPYKISNYLYKLPLNRDSESCLYRNGHSIKDSNLKDKWEKTGYVEYSKLTIEEAEDKLKQKEAIGIKIYDKHLMINPLFVSDVDNLIFCTSFRDVNIFYPGISLNDFLNTYFSDLLDGIEFYEIKHDIKTWLN